MHENQYHYRTKIHGIDLQFFWKEENKIKSN